MALIKEHSRIEEGEVVCKWFEGRVINRNKNVLIAVTGPTGSGKSWWCLRLAEKWYDRRFQEEFPVEKNVCFSIGKAIRRLDELLKSGKLRRGEILIIEEAGVINNALDFQNKISKLFNFVLQSFRKFNIILLFNLPVLTFMSKSSRLLIHAHVIMQGVDEQKKKSRVKLYIHQLNEQSGKSYWKFLRIRFNGKVMPIKKMNFDSPSDGIIDIYEKLKSEFVLGLTKEFVEELEQIDRDNIRKEGRNNLTDIEFEVLKMIQEGKSVKEIAQIREKGLRTIYECMERIKNKGFDVKKGHIRLENEVFAAPNPIPRAF